MNHMRMCDTKQNKSCLNVSLHADHLAIYQESEKVKAQIDIQVCNYCQ